MKNILLLLFLVISPSLFAQNTAKQRAAALGIGANLSYLENYWGGTKAQHYGNHVNMAEVVKRKPGFQQMRSLGFGVVRIPFCGSAWASLAAPYKWDFPENLAALDSLVKWGTSAGLTVIVDLHHPELDGTFPTAIDLPRLQWIWTQIATRYKNTNPDKVLFELQNEPHDITAAAWRIRATALLETVRSITPNHTIVVGAEDWNGRDALMRLQPLTDPNIIYTFHFYDPFVFTHQGAEWVTGMNEVKGVPFPYNGLWKPVVPASVKGTWIENSINGYASEGNPDVLFARLQAVKEWSDRQNVPIFLGEGGSYRRFADENSRCFFQTIIFSATGLLNIPITYWEWDGGFSLFETNTSNLSPCMAEAIKAYQNRATGKSLGISETIVLSPNPTDSVLQVEVNGQTPNALSIFGTTGQALLHTEKSKIINTSSLSSGSYIVRIIYGQGVATRIFVKK